jgi:hypothetical protein
MPPGFWGNFAALPAAAAIVLASGDPFHNTAVVRAVAESGRTGEVALYTGDPGNIIMDLLRTWRFGDTTVRVAGGVLEPWAVWTLRAVRMLEQLREEADRERPIARGWLTLAAEVTDSYGAICDAANGFCGSAAGIHEILRRQGLLDRAPGLSPGQMAEIDRVCAVYPHLNDDAFVARHLDAWLR